MIKRYSVLTLMITLLSAMFILEPIQAQTARDGEVAKTRVKVAKIGVGQNAKVEVKLRDQSTLKGYIRELNQDSFTVVERETAAERNLAYADVAGVKRSGSGLSGKSWAFIGAAAAGAVVTWIIVKPALCDGGAQTRGIC